MWEYFSVDELKCKGTDECNMDEGFMERLVTLRHKFNEPMVVSSGYRDSSYNQVIGGVRNSPHLHGKAVDILIGGKGAYRLIGLAIQQGFTVIHCIQVQEPAFIWSSLGHSYTCKALLDGKTY